MNQRQKYVIFSILAVAVVSTMAFWGVVQYLQPEQDTLAETASPPAVSATVAPKPTADPHVGQVRSSMTGQWVDKSVENKRAFAVMINNIEYAFKHQMGTSKADIMYEALAEGGITRMMAIYQDVSDVKKIGSVRSARHYYVQFATEWDAVYCHFGHTHYATSKMKKLKTENISGLSAIGPVAYARTSTLSAPHNVFTTGQKLRKAAKKLGYSLKKKRGARAGHFVFHETDTEPVKGKRAKTVTIPFSNYSTCQMKYDEKKKKYLKYEYGKKHMDQYYKKQLSFKNVIIQFVDESNIDRNGYQTMKLNNSSGKGYYITDGKQVSITWERREKGNAMVYTDAAGNTLTVNPGKTYIAVYPKNRKNLVQTKG